MIIRNCLDLLGELSEIEVLIHRLEKGKLEKKDLDRIMQLVKVSKKKAS